MGAEQRGRRPRKDSRKRFSPQGRKGDQGIAFIHGVVSAMGFVWVENKGYADAGIDGFIELADPNTGEAFNRRLLVQSKAGPSYFKNERGDTFEFHCDQRDLDYWLSGDAPVILVVSRHGIEGYWVSIKDYFATTERASARKILFDKATDSFDSTARSKLFDLGSAGSGIFLQPIPKYETLFSNLVPLELGFEKVYLGTTHIESEAEFDRQMSPGHDAPLWAVHEGLVTSVCDLRNSSFQEVVDHGSIEEWSVREASESPELESRMIHLLGRIVRTFLATFKVRYHNVREFYYFQANHRQGGPAPRMFRYRSYKQDTHSEVVANISKIDRTDFACWRHAAAEVSFRFIAGTWHAVINPTYFFTNDGFHKHPKSTELLKGKKSLEHNLAVRGQTRMWCDLLQYNQPSLLETEPPVRFRGQYSIDLPFGLVDADWLPPPPEFVASFEVDTDRTGQEGLF
jgi:hypothetical protein